MALRLWLVALGSVRVLWANAKSFDSLIKEAKKRKLTGYELIDALDVWYGRNSPEYAGPHRLLDRLGNGDGRVTASDWAAVGLPAEHFEYFDRDRNRLLDVHEAHSWHQQRQPARTMNLSEVGDPPRGHLQPLGSWKDPLPSEDLVYRKPYPHPREFWKKHMDGYLPAVLKGAQEGWPAMGWTKEVLTERFGWVEAKLEPKLEARGNDTAYRDLDTASPRHRLNISEYLRVEAGRNMYVVSVIPQDMAWEVAHPSVLLCGSRRKILSKKSRPPYEVTDHMYPHESKFDWMTHVFEANLWMSSGYTRSQFHYDKEWNVNCLLSGTKRWFFLNPFWYDGDLQWSRGEKFLKDDPLNNRWTDWVFLDADRVDLIVQHKLRTMDYYELTQEAGDCLFIPYAMLHQVSRADQGPGGQDLGVAVSWMFLPETIYEESVCGDAPLEEDLPLAAMDVLYMYTGRGVIPQGYMDPLEMVQGVARLMKERKEKHLSRATLTDALTQGDAILANARGSGKKIKGIYDMLTAYASDPKKGLTRRELRKKVPLRLWSKPAAEGDNEGPLPCDHGEEYFPCDDQEYHKMRQYVEEKLAAHRRHAEGARKLEAGATPPFVVKNQRTWGGRRSPEPRTEL